MSIIKHATYLSSPVFAVLLLILFNFVFDQNFSMAEPIDAARNSGMEANDYLESIFTSRKGVIPATYSRKWLDLAYADHSPSQKLDIYLPDEGKGPFPVIIAIHGGSFVQGDKRDFQIVPMLEALKHTYAVVAVNYRLSQEAKFPSQIHDIKAAVRWIRANGGNYALNQNKIAVWGDSAGGNLAALAGTSEGVRELEDMTMGNPEQSSRVDAVVDWYGPINFLTMGSQLKQNNQTPRKSNSSYIGKSKEEAPELYTAASPETYIHPGMPPFFIQHGNSDRIIPLQQSLDFAAQLEKQSEKGRVVLDIIENANHLDEKFTTQENLNKVLSFLDKVLK
jgi:acetyl esterase/lipase